MKKRTTKPTDSELEILGVLWEKGPSTVRQVHSQLAERKKEIGYTTVLKLMQIMAEKALVVRDESNRSHVYEAKFEQEQTQQLLLTDLLKRAFGGAADRLVMQALRTKKISDSEIQEIRKMLDDLEGENR